MIKIQWDAKFSVGNEKIDREHRVFLDLVRSCSEAVEDGSDPGFTLRLLEELSLYARFHFFSEETLMIKSAYPDQEAHHRDHVRLLAELRDRIHEYREDTSTGNDLILFLFEWFALHTSTVDSQLAGHLSATV